MSFQLINNQKVITKMKPMFVLLAISTCFLIMEVKSDDFYDSLRDYGMKISIVSQHLFCVLNVVFIQRNKLVKQKTKLFYEIDLLRWT